nr:R3H domain-containing nucleic acid-binding protein [Scytonema millei]
MSDEQIGQRGQQWLEQLLQLSGVSTQVTAKLQTPKTENSDPEEHDSYWLTIEQSSLLPEQVQALIGAEGSVLDAIQYLANATLNLNQPQERQAAYIIELDGYRLRRQAEIQAIATSAIEQVRTTGQEVEIKSLSSAERRQIHTFLKDFSDLESFSRGKEPHRQLVIRTIGSS